MIGRPDAKWGEAVRAVIVLRDGEKATESEIMEWCSGRLAGYKRPISVSVYCRCADAEDGNRKDPASHPQVPPVTGATQASNCKRPAWPAGFQRDNRPAADALGR